MRRFHSAQSGAVAIIFVLCFIPILLIVGLALDYSKASQRRAALNNVADAAALAAIVKINEKRDEIKNEGELRKLAYVEAENVFTSQSAFDETKIYSLDINIEKTTKGWIATVNYKANVKGSIGAILGFPSLDVSGVAQSTSQSKSYYMDIYMLLDTSSSMGIGATEQDLQKMREITGGCVFGCHIAEYKPVHYDQPKAAGVKMRIDILRDATSKLIDTAIESSSNTGQYKIGLYAFNSQQNILEDMTADLQDVKAKSLLIDLPTSHDGTHAGDALSWLNQNKVQPSYDGTKPDKPKRFVFLITDGVEDGIHTGHAPPPAAGPTGIWPDSGASAPTSGIDPYACNAIKAKDVTVAVLYTTYLPFPDLWQWNLIQPFQQKIAENLRRCASDGFFFEASTPGEIDRAMQEMFEAAVVFGAPRLSR
ncbi:MAG: vWA domain-containing protein [Pseudomonadota bacterium]